MNRNFKEWFSTFSPSISNYSYYTDFEKILKNVDSINVELNILNSLIGSKNISNDFIELVKKYPETLKCIPILLAVRSNEIFIKDEDKELIYNFKKPNMKFSDYAIFMKKTGLFSLMERSQIKDLVDYVTGVETGLDSNSRKNRGGHIMENLVESHISKYCQEHNCEYFKEMRS